MSLDVITDSPRANTDGAKGIKGNQQTIIPTIELSNKNDFNEEESDSSSDDVTVFHRERLIMAANRRERSENTATIVVKTPFLQTMSTESDTSMASSESSDLSIRNHNSSIRSSTCSESESEDDLQTEPNIILDLSQILGELKVTVKDDDETHRTSPREDDTASLSTEISKLNLGDKLDNAKYLVEQERTPPRYALNNTDVSAENRDSDTSHEPNNDDSEDEDTYHSRGKSSIVKTNRQQRTVPYRQHENSPEQMEAWIEKMYSCYTEQINGAIELAKCSENQTPLLNLQSSECTTTYVDSSATSTGTDNTFWPTDCELRSTYHSSQMLPIITVDQPLSSSSSRSDGSAYGSESNNSYHEQLDADSWNIYSGTNSNVANMVPSTIALRDFYNGQDSLSTYGVESSPYGSSTNANSPYTTDSSSINSPASRLSSNDEISGAIGVEHFGDFGRSSISETNDSRTAEMQENQSFIETMNLPLKHDPNLNSTSQSPPQDLNQIDNDTFATFNFLTETNFGNVMKMPGDPITDEADRSNSFNLQYNNVSNTTSPILNQLSPNLCPSPDTANQWNSNSTASYAHRFSNITTKYKKDTNPVTMNINTGTGTKGFVTVTGQNNDHNSFINSTSIANVKRNSPSLEQDSNGIQVAIISTNSYDKKQTWNYKANIDQPSSFSTGQMRKQPTSNTSVPKFLIPTTIKERTTAPKEKSGTTDVWKSLNLPSSDTCERLKKTVNERDVLKAKLKVLEWPDERFSQKQRNTSDTPLMERVRDPATLGKNLPFLLAIVQRMLRVPKTFMETDDKGRDALYLAAVHCPNKPYVAGYLAVTIAELCKKNIVQLNKYRNGDTLLHAVAAQGDTHLDVMNELLAIKMNKDRKLFDLLAQNNFGKQPLHLAAEARNQSKRSGQMIQLLLKKLSEFSPKGKQKQGNRFAHGDIAGSQRSDCTDCRAVTMKNYTGNLPIQLTASDLNFASLETQAGICRHLVDDGSLTNEPNKMPLATERKEVTKNIFHKKC